MESSNGDSNRDSKRDSQVDISNEDSLIELSGGESRRLPIFDRQTAVRISIAS